MKARLSWGRNTSIVTFRCPYLLEPDHKKPALDGTLRSWCFINSWGNETQRSEGAFLVSHNNEVVGLRLPAWLSPNLCLLHLGSAVSEPHGQVGPALNRLIPWVRNYHSLTWSIPIARKPWLMHHQQPDITLCVVHFPMCWGASLFHIGSFCLNPGLLWSQLLYFPHCLRQRSQHAFLMSLFALGQKWVEAGFSHGSRPHKTVDIRMWHSHFSGKRKRDFHLLSGRGNDRKATAARAGRQTVVSHH